MATPPLKSHLHHSLHHFSLPHIRYTTASPDHHHHHQNADHNPRRNLRSTKEIIKCNKGTPHNLNLKSQSHDQRKPKRKLWISLSAEEIEEDVYAFTGAKPARRPRKWPRNVKKHLDNVFPGLYLVGVSADSYRAMMF